MPLVILDTGTFNNPPGTAVSAGFAASAGQPLPVTAVTSGSGTALAGLAAAGAYAAVNSAPPVIQSGMSTAQASALVPFITPQQVYPSAALTAATALPAAVGSTLPPGVTLKPIDGGPTYYADNGFTYAASASFNGMSWDDPRFFPVGDDYSFYPANSPATFKTLGLNFSHRITGDTNASLLYDNGIWLLPDGIPPGMGAETMGFHVEEPSAWTGIVSAVQGFQSALPGRFFQCSFTWNQFVYGGLSGTPSPGTMQAVMSSPVSTSAGNVHLNVPGDDIYWFAGSTIASYAQYYGGLIYGLGQNMTADQCARGCRYGDMVDMMRSWVSAYPAPVGAPYIETEDGLTGTGSREITPPELNQAAWSTIIHGARWLLYFGTTSNFGSGSTFGFSQDILAGQSVSMFDQAVATNGLVAQLAPVINSPFALGYFTVTPAPVVISASAADSGIDAMAKYVTNGGPSGLGTGGSTGNGFYIFATTRDSETAANISATFTTADHYAGPVTVVNESRTVTAAGGVFTDTFATGLTVHIYYIP